MYLFSLVVLFICLFLASGGAQCLLLAPCSGISPGGIGEPYAMLGSEPGLAACKTSALTVELSRHSLEPTMLLTSKRAEEQKTKLLMVSNSSG